MRRLTAESGFAALTILAVPMGPIYYVHLEGLRAPLFWIEVFGYTLALILLCTGLIRPRRYRLRPVALTVVLAAPLSVPLLAYPLSISFLTYRNLVGGLLIGSCLAAVWSNRSVSHLGPLDVALGATAWIIMVQLALAVLPHPLASWHRYAETSWGGSNYVAVVLLLIGLGIWIRHNEIGFRLLLLLGGAASTAGIVLTLSRSILTTLFICVGISISWTRLPLNKLGTRTIQLMVVCGAAYMVGTLILETRGYSLSDRNVTARRDLAVIAWNEFSESPIIGTGYGQLRQATFLNPQGAQSYAHNIALSLLQQAGLFSIPVLGYMFSRVAWKSTGRSAALRTAMLGVLIAAMFEVLFEGLLAGCLAWMLLNTKGIENRDSCGNPDLRSDQGSRSHRDLP